MGLVVSALPCGVWARAGAGPALSRPAARWWEACAQESRRGWRGQGERGCWLLFWQVPGTELREHVPQAI